jgi:hypothetical protein
MSFDPPPGTPARAKADNSATALAKTSFEVLATSASELNASSDRLGKVASRIDSSFQKLNIGIQGWVRFHEDRTDDGLRFWFNEVGYAKINGKWGLAINSGSGNEIDEHLSALSRNL